MQHFVNEKAKRLSQNNLLFLLTITINQPIKSLPMQSYIYRILMSYKCVIENVRVQKEKYTFQRYTHEKCGEKIYYLSLLHIFSSP